MVLKRRELLKTMTVLGGTGLGVSFAGCAGQQSGSTPTGTATPTERGTEPSMAESPTERPTTAAPTGTSGGVVGVGTHPEYGELLVDANGRTLYMFTRDSDGESACYGDCASAWPPLTVEGEDALEAGPNVTATLGTTERDDGSLQVTAGGMPLYYFVRDENPGDATGQGVNDVWFVLRPDGSVLMASASTDTDTNTST